MAVTPARAARARAIMQRARHQSEGKDEGHHFRNECEGQGLG